MEVPDEDGQHSGTERVSQLSDSVEINPPERLMTEEEIAKMRKQYCIPSIVGLRPVEKNEHVHNLPAGHISVHHTQFKIGI